MHGDVLVSLLEPVVLLDVVEVVSSDDDGVFHLGRDDETPALATAAYLKTLPLIATSPVKGHFLSMYVPVVASFGVLKPRPTVLTYLKPFLILAALRFFLFMKTVGCLRNDFSVCCVNTRLRLPS